MKCPKDNPMAKSLEELNKKAALGKETYAQRSATSLAGSANKLYTEAVKQYQLSNYESAYIYFFRFLEINQVIRKKPGKNADGQICAKKCKAAVTKLEELSDNLSKSYQQYKEQKSDDINSDLESPSNISPTNLEADGSKSSSNHSIITNGIHSSDSAAASADTITCLQLYDMIKSNTSLVIFDVRPEQEFLDSHIDHSHCVNIPAEILKPGLTAAAVGKALPEAVRTLWNKRAIVDYVVLLDEESTRQSMTSGSPLDCMNLAISKWDHNNLLKSDPLILDGGFDNWRWHYPTMRTNPLISKSKPIVSINNPEFRNSLPYIDVDFPDFDSILESPDEEEFNSLTNPVISSNGANFQEGNLQNANSSSPFFIERLADTSFQSRALQNSLPPTFDRKIKPTVTKEAWGPHPPKNTAMQQVLQDQKNIVRNDLKNSEQQLQHEKAFEALRNLRENQASLQMLEEVQRKEEELMIIVQGLEEDKKVLHNKWKESEREKEILKQQMKKSGELTETLEQLAIAEKQRKREILDAEVKRLREERKTKEKEDQRKREEEETASEERRKEEQRKEEEKILRDYLASQKIQPVSPKKVSPLPPKPIIPVAPKELPLPNKLDVTHGPGIYTTRLKESPEHSSTMRGLSRSHSSPNIAQLAAEDAYSDSQTKPSFVEKQFPKVKLDACTPNINRTLKPIDASAARLRNFSPVYSSQPTTQTGLKNLGNTCFMNSVLQCINHTQPLADYLVSSTYFNDINRYSESKGEVIQELASVIQNLRKTAYRSISPNEFKMVVSRYMSICAGYEQQDAHEFLVILMDKLHLETNKGNRGLKPPNLDNITSTEEALCMFWSWHTQLNNSRMVQLFEGVLQSRLTCSTCKHGSNSYEVFSSLSLPIPANNKCSLKDCIQSFLKAETMKGEAAWSCPHCKRKQEAEKKMGICQLPQILIIHLKRFSYEGLWRRKLTTTVDFPLFDLDMHPYLTVDSQTYKYNLYGVVNHYGTLEGGHYTAFCRSDKWFKYDDHDVQPMQHGEVKSSAGFILFYAAT